MDDKKMHELLGKLPVPEPKSSKKQETIEMAMQAFEQAEKSKKNNQGSSLLGRLIDRTVYWINQQRRNFMKRSMVIGGTVAACAVVIALNATTILTTFGPQAPREEVTEAEKQALLSVTDEVSRNTAVPSKDKKEAAKATAGNRPADASVAPLEANKAQFSAKEMPATAPPAPMAAQAPTTMTFQQKRDVQAPARGRVAGEMLNKRMPAVTGGFMGGGDMVIAPQYQDVGRDQFEDIKVNPVKLVSEEPVSTFSIDVDTSSYSFMRRELNHGRLPQKDAIRVEELINYFDYDYAVPEDSEVPFKPSVSVFETPWNAKTKLIHIGIKGYDIEPDEKPRSNLVFLLDVSGSMNHQDKLPLLKNAFSMMVESLHPDDTVGIVVYAGAAGTVLEPTKVKEKAKILAALDQLSAGGSTAGGEGIRQAYSLAEANFDKEAVNRVILATDGDFNVGITDREELKGFIERKRETGIFLSVLGFGQGNYNDALMQALAQNGNGNAAYIDNLNEARKVLVEEASSTLFPIAKDVKIQVEFNPLKVAEYRLVGYETRLLKREDFNNDKVDAGDIGSGHTVTAIYEITPTDSDARLIDDLRYSKEEAKAPKKHSDEYAFLKMRYKLPEEDKSKLITQEITAKQEIAEIEDVAKEARFATAVAAYGQILRADPYTKDYSYDDVIALAEEARGRDRFGYRSEFLNLVRLAKTARGLQKTQ